MHRPKIPKNPKIFRNYQARPWQSSKKSWDSWESWACAWILHFVHRDSWESWACAGFMKVLCQIMLFIRKQWNCPCVFWWWTSELVQRVLIFWWNFWKWRTGFWFCTMWCFLRQVIAIEIILHTVYSKNTGIYSGFCMCRKLKDEDEDTYVIHPLLQVGPGRGVTIYIYIYMYIIYLFSLDIMQNSQNHPTIPRHFLEQQLHLCPRSPSPPGSMSAASAMASMWDHRESLGSPFGVPCYWLESPVPWWSGNPNK